MREKLKDHILVFGLFSSFCTLMTILGKKTLQNICYVSPDYPQKHIWPQLKSKYSNICYLLCSYKYEELINTSIQNAFHIIFLSSEYDQEKFSDSSNLFMFQLIQEYFPNKPFTMFLFLIFFSIYFYFFVGIP